MNEKTKQKQMWRKRCINCDAFGYKTGNDWKYFGIVTGGIDG